MLKVRVFLYNFDPKMALLGLVFLPIFMASQLTQSQEDPLSEELRNWVQIDIINSGKWLALTTTHSEDQSNNESLSSQKSEEPQAAETSEISNEKSSQSVVE